MRSLEDLPKDVIDDQDRVLFHEAVACASSGAVRAAYVFFWISCAESLKRRFAAISVRDNVAKKVAGEIARREEAHAAIDLYVLEQARKYGFIDDAGHSQLKHVYEMRCVYGHPYERLPSQEELLAAATVVLDLVLSKPLLLRHGYLQEQVRLLSTDPVFLDDQEQAVAEYAQEVAARVDPDLSLWFIEKLWLAGEAVVADKSQAKIVRRLVWFSTTFISKSLSVVAGIDMRIPLTQSPVMGSWVMSSPALFEVLSSHAQNIAIGNLTERMPKTVAGARRLQDLDAQGLLNDRQRRRFDDSLAGVHYSSLAEADVDVKYYVDRIVGDMKVKNWYVQNPAIEAIVNVGPMRVAHLSGDIQCLLGNNVLQCGEGSAKKAIALVNDMAEGKAIWPPTFVEGLLVECFVNEKNVIRFKTRLLGQALAALGLHPAEEIERIVAIICSRLKQGVENGCVVSECDRDEVSGILDSVLTMSGGGLSALQAVRDKVISIPSAERCDD